MHNKFYMAAVYLRLPKEDGDLSTHVDKAESNSIANQKALILKELESMPDVTLYDIYIDDGFTGLNFDRPEFKRMLADIYDEKINMVVVNDLSRLGRDYIESGRYVKKIFPALNIRFVSILDRFDSVKANASEVNLLIPIKNFVNDNYSRDISGKVRSHQEIMRENGLYIGAYVAYGYKKSEKNKNKMVPDPYAGEIVKKIVSWIFEGMSPGTIADKPNILGILPPSEYKRFLGINYKNGFKRNAKAKWTPVAVIRILRNRIYTGVLEQGKREKINYKLSEVVNKPEDQWVTIENSHEALISKLDFEIIGRLLDLDTRRAPGLKTTYLFSGLIFCGDCGLSMVRRAYKYKTKEKGIYICSTYNKGKGCSRHPIDEGFLKEVVLDFLNRYIEQIAQLEQILDTMMSMEIKYDEIIASDEEILQKYQELEKCKRMELSLHRDLLEGIISQEDMISLGKSIRTKRKKLKTQFKNFDVKVKKYFKRGYVLPNG